MTTDTRIQWTEKTWNPIAGCSVVSPGCTNCYAMRRTAPRLSQHPATPQYHGTVQPSKAGYVWTGKIGIAGDKKFLEPLRIRKPAMWFVNSTSDLFHEDVPDEVIDRVFAVMALCPQHTFQILTKRSTRMRDYLTGDGARQRMAWAEVPAVMNKHAPGWQSESIHENNRKRAIWAGQEWPLPNVWLGISVEDQTRADERIPDLLATRATVRFIFAEPLLGSVDITKWLHATGGATLASSLSTAASATPCLDWVIVGGESGHGARPMHPDWARSIRDQCAAADVPYFFKQWGEWAPGEVTGPNERAIDAATRFDRRWMLERVGKAQSDGHRDGEPDMFRIGTKAAGRLLDGVEHNEIPASGLPLKSGADEPGPEHSR